MSRLLFRVTCPECRRKFDCHTKDLRHTEYLLHCPYCQHRFHQDQSPLIEE